MYPEARRGGVWCELGVLLSVVICCCLDSAWCSVVWLQLEEPQDRLAFAYVYTVNRERITVSSIRVRVWVAEYLLVGSENTMWIAKYCLFVQSKYMFGPQCLFTVSPV